MFHFLAKLGQKPWVKQVTGVLISGPPLIYLGVHCYGHKVIRNLFIAEDDRNKISDGLQTIIMSVTDDIKDVFNVNVIPKLKMFPNMGGEPTPIKWFPSSTLMPTTFGTTYSKKGIIVGLPNYLNYDKVEDIPDSMFFIKKVKLFKEKNSQQSEAAEIQQTDQPDPGVLNSAEKSDIMIRLSKSDPEVKHYAETLILSEKAKKFVIARELFFGDSTRVPYASAVMLISGFISVMVSRIGVTTFKLLDAHVSQRMAMYCVGGAAGLVNYRYVSDASNREYVLAADKKAATLNADYMDGAKEFFQKTIERNKALRNLVEDFSNVYDEKGNFKQPMLSFKMVPLDERLRIVSREPIVEQQTKVEE